MAKDSKQWEEAYNAYIANRPKKGERNGTMEIRRHKLKRKPVEAPVERQESMVLTHQVIDIDRKIKELRAQRKLLIKQLARQGQGKKIASYLESYVDQPIFLYALRLSNGHFYIGMTRNVDRRYKTHMKGKGSMWTKLYPPVEILEVRPTNSDNDSDGGLMEDEMTIEYARRYGVQVVHGGGYCQRKPRWPPIAFEPLVLIQ